MSSKNDKEYSNPNAAIASARNQYGSEDTDEDKANMVTLVTTPEGQLIRLTHYINPHLFWFKTEHSFLCNNNLYELEYKLQKYASSMNEQKQKYIFGYEPKETELIMVMHLPWNKWIRAKVDKILEYSNERNYILWAIDHGVPLHSVSKWLRPIPEDLANIQIESVYKGGLANCVPAEIGFDYEIMVPKLTNVKKWSENAATTVERLLFDASSIKYVQKCIFDDNHRFGEIEIETHTGKRINPRIILDQLNHATTIHDPDEFYKALNKCETRSVLRWQNNNGHVVFEFMKNSLHNRTDFVRENIVLSTPPLEAKLALEEAHPNEMEQVNQKIDDWHIRNNEKLQMISDDDFMDSVSVVASTASKKPTKSHTNSKKLQMTTNKEEKLNHANVADIDDEYFMKNCGKSSRISKKSIPPRPKEILSPEPPVSILLNKNTNKSSVIDQNESIVAQATVATAATTSFNNERLPTRLLARLNARLNALEDKNTQNENKINQADENIVQKPFVPAGFGLNELHTFNKTTSELQKQNFPHKSLPNQPKPQKSKNNNNNNVDDDENWTTNSNRLKKTSNTKDNQASSIADNQTNRFPHGGATNNDDSMQNYQRPLNNYTSFKKNNENSQCISNSLFLYRILVHGGFPPEWIDGIKNANFCEDVYKQMELLRLTRIYRIQSVAWPHIMRGNSFVVINSAGTGKTISYLPAICSIIKEKYDDETVPDGCGPIGIIICRSSQQVTIISDRCQRFFNHKLKVIKAHGKRDLKNFICSLLNGCAILVTTAPCLTRLLNEETETINLFDKKRVQHLIIDDLDLICCRFKNELKNIIIKFGVLEKSEKFTQVQMIATSRTWNPMLKIFFKISMNPILCIGAYIESAIYAKTKIQIKLLKNMEKCNKLISVLMEIPLNQRTIIICNKMEEVNDIILRLKDESKDFVYCYDNSTAEEISLVKEWNKTINDERYPVLICTDGVLNEIDITFAQNIIHYSMPATWTAFSYRFSASFNYYDDLVVNKISTKPEATSLILLDENNNEQLPRLIQFLLSHGTRDINQAVLNLAKRLSAKSEDDDKKRMVPFCSSLLLLGECTDKESGCQQRHVLTGSDRSEDYIPKSGKVKLQILFIHSPTHYSARILSHKSMNSTKWEKLTISNNCWQIQMLSYYANIDNHVNHYPVNVGDLCVISEDIMGNATYYRCRIIEVIKQRSQISVKVYYIDVGKPIITCLSSELLHLTDEFKCYPPQAIDVRISNIVPIDFDKEWDVITQKTVKSWLDKNINKNVHIEGRIQITVLNCIWVNTLVLMQDYGKLPIQSKSNSTNFMPILSIRHNLLKKQFGNADDKCLNELKKMAKIAGIPLESATVTNEEDDEDNGDNKENTQNIEIAKEIITPIKKIHENNSVNHEIQSNKKTPVQNRGGRGRFLTKTSIRKTSLLNLLPKLNINNSSPDFGCDDNASSLDCTSTSSVMTTSTTSSNRLSLSFNTTTDQDDGGVHLTNNKQNSHTEIWEYLHENEFHDIFISTFYSPNLFYIQKFSLKLDNLYNKIDSYMDKILLVNEIDNHIITEPTIGLICLAKFNGENYNRAKIIGISCDNDGILNAKIFFVDLGQKADCSVTKLYQIPDYLIEYIPFQAIRCKLIGIDPPKFNENDKNDVNNRWPNEICDKMYTEFLELCAHNILRPIHEIYDHHTADDKLLMHQKSYECVLIDCDSFNEDIIFNEKFVELGLAKYNEKTKHHIDIGKSFNRQNMINDEKKMNKREYNDDDYYEDEQNWNDSDDENKSTFNYKKLTTSSSSNSIKLDDIDVQFTNEEIMELLNLPPTAKLIPKPPSPTIEEVEEVEKEEEDRVIINECEKDLNNDQLSSSEVNLSSDQNDMDSIVDDVGDDSAVSGGNLKLRQKRKKSVGKIQIKSIPMPTLFFQQKIPKIQWKQTDCLILLTIEAPDVKNYFLHVTNTWLQFCAKINNENSAIFLNLFGCLDTEFTSHEIRGLNIHVRLMKTLRGIQWPRLLASADHYHWLKYNLDAIECDDQQLLLDSSSLWTNIDKLRRKQVNDFYPTDSSSEEEKYDFEPIKLQYQDPADPYAEDFD